MTNYLIIGSGRWANHLQKCLALAGLTHTTWARKLHSQTDLQEKIGSASHVWLAISDQALSEWAERLVEFPGLVLHSSGALEIAGTHSVHPLMSFGPDLYADAFYSKFALVTTSDVDRELLIPGLRNPFARITPEKKAFYHAMCVLAGNGSVLLWQKFFAEMNRLGIPQDVSSLYTQQVSENTLHRPQTALTGPLVRNDEITLQKDLEALDLDAFRPVLAALIEAYQNVGGKLI